ncbi:sensor histidine kinase [Clostridium oryzae]|uniref:Sensor histidine kinase YpdA n=1 Tax=Clostridium oryzae TaxID=1450648 RepID=A0A1V4IMD7_9CLOT|nr:histidine kinase [Clostridium oryzae]OPJ61188.1 sensor histidine kinase YpdA [Clostridium oryzae]
MKRSILRNVVLFLAFFLLLTLIMFSYIREISSEIIKNSLSKTAENQIKYTTDRLRTTTRELEILGMNLTTSNQILNYQSNKKQMDYLNQLLSRESIRKSLNNQIATSNFVASLCVYWPGANETISTDNSVFDKHLLTKHSKNRWIYYNQELHYIITYPYFNKSEYMESGFLVDVTINHSFLKELLEGVIVAENSTSLFYFNNNQILSNNSNNKKVIEKIKQKGILQKDESNKVHFNKIDIDNRNYIFQDMYINFLDAYLISYTRTNSFLEPMMNLNRLFSLALIIVLIFGMSLIVIFYLKYVRQIYTLVDSFNKVAKGNYTVQIKQSKNDEFGFLFKRFNQMVFQIGQLTKRLKLENVLRRDAEYMQLQSQINPHFLYNSLFYIISMANKSSEAVIQMANHLAKYYRYATTRNNAEITVSSELELAEHYLAIMSIRKKKLSFSIDMPDEMREVNISPLLIQPIVENAVVHGIEVKQNASFIRIKGEIREKGWYYISIEDDGAGMSSEEQKKLRIRLNESHPANGVKSVGLWNIHQRLKNLFGEEAGLIITTSELGGLKVSFSFRRERLTIE